MADILLHVHGAEYPVTKFLFELHRNGYVEISGTKTIVEPAAPEAQAEPAPQAEPEILDDPLAAA